MGKCEQLSPWSSEQPETLHPLDPPQLDQTEEENNADKVERATEPMG